MACLAFGCADDWESQPTGARFRTFEIDFPDADHGWYVGDWGEINFTTNGGRKWKRKRIPDISKKMLLAVEFYDVSTGWIAGDDGLLLATKDGGKSWAEQDIGTTMTLYGLEFVDRETGWGVGYSGTIVHTMDGGETWESQSCGVQNEDLLNVSFFDHEVGWVVVRGNTQGYVLRTENGGATWEKPTNGVSPRYPLSVSAVSREEAWVSCTEGSLFHTTDAGETWVAQRIHKSWSSLETIDFIDSSHGWIGGWAGGNTLLAYFTKDGGNTWTRSRLPGRTAYADLTISPDGTVFVLGRENVYALRPENQP